MKFNSDPTKQAQEIIFGKKKTVSIHPIFYFNTTPVNSNVAHKHFGMILDSKLSFENHLQSVCSRVNKTIGLLRKCQPTLPKKSLVTIYRWFTSLWIFLTWRKKQTRSLLKMIDSYCAPMWKNELCTIGSWTDMDIMPRSSKYIYFHGFQIFNAYMYYKFHHK